MRLLRATGQDDFSVAEFIHDIPTYAILSHTWGADEDEVTFKDVFKGKGKGKMKPGYAKLQFCAAQAAKDGITYFWIDTCCIDKSSSAELAEAINSMFKWYRNSAVCYVYLSDVFSCSGQQPVITNSRWFERGWTLQELLAPEHLVFCSMNGTRIGDKYSLAKEIALKTEIPLAVLENGPGLMLEYTIEERMIWAMFRSTKREEDSAYCLLGIFGVQMPLIYGEGKEKAFVRLRKEIEAVHGQPDWIADLLDRYRLWKRQIPWDYRYHGAFEIVKLLILLYTIFFYLVLIVHDLQLRIGFLWWVVVATTLYLHDCTRWNRAEGTLIFFLVVGISYTAGKLIGLQREVEKLNDIVFDKAMVQDIGQQTMHT